MFLKRSTPEVRLQEWRDVREIECNSATDIAPLFARVKTINHYLDFYTPETWPNVFDIVADGNICQTGLTLIIAATIYSKNFIKTDKIRFPVISNNMNGAIGAVFEHDGMIYNFLPGEVVTTEFMENNSTPYSMHELKPSNLFK